MLIKITGKTTIIKYKNKAYCISHVNSNKIRVYIYIGIPSYGFLLRDDVEKTDFTTGKIRFDTEEEVRRRKLEIGFGKKIRQEGIPRGCGGPSMGSTNESE